MLVSWDQNVGIHVEVQLKVKYNNYENMLDLVDCKFDTVIGEINALLK